MRFAATTLCAVALALCAPTPAHAAESEDACTGFVDAVPATIAQSGIWCLRKDLATAITSGAAISIRANNVTLDCNGFKLGGLAAGNASIANGVSVSDSQNATIRNCGIRGFARGVSISGGNGHAVEDNRLDNNLVTGLHVLADGNSVVRGNRVFDTGGAPGSSGMGIYARADVRDNTVSGVFSAVAQNFLVGIQVDGDGYEVRGNRVSGLAAGSNDTATAYRLLGNELHVVDNWAAGGKGLGTGIAGFGTNTFCVGNAVSRFARPFLECESSSGNRSLP